MIGETLALLLAIIIVFFLSLQRSYKFWNGKNVPFIKPQSIFGNFKELLFGRKCPADLMEQIYNNKEFKSSPIVGIYVLNKPGLVIREPEIIKQILVGDFNKFRNRFAASDPHSDGLGANSLFFVKNLRWKQIRTKLTPVFTSGKLKQIFILVEEIGHKLDSYLRSLTLNDATRASTQEVREISACFSTDVIASTAYGIDANSLKNPDAEFRRNGREIFDANFLRSLELLSFFFAPQLVRLFRCKIFTKKSTKFIRNTINYVMDERIKSGEIRNDLINVLIEFKKLADLDTNKENFHLKGDALIAQAAIFFTAGFETTSSTMSFTLYEIAKNKTIQDRLRQEIKDALLQTNGKITYEMIHEMEYLNMVLKEILRLYPPIPFLDRECTLDSNESGFSLKPYINFEIPNGMPVFIPIYAIQRDEKYWSDPTKFDPERFSSTNTSSHTPFTNLPFGSGPRNCIGERFGLIQTKVGLISFLKNHYVQPSEKFPREIELHPQAIFLQTVGGIHCDFVWDPLLKEE